LISTFLLKKIEEAIKNGQSKDTGNIGHRTFVSDRGKETTGIKNIKSNIRCVLVKHSFIFNFNFNFNFSLTLNINQNIQNTGNIKKQRTD